MDKQRKNQDLYAVEVGYLLKAVWKRLWAVILIGILVAAIAFCYYSFFVTPQPF